MRLTTDLANHPRLAWTPQLQVAFSNRSTRSDALIGDKINLTSLDGGPANMITTGTDVYDVLDWSRDGQSVLYTRVSQETGTDIWGWSRERQAFPVVQTPQTDRSAFFSRDGRWIVYETEEGGRSEIFVQRFPPAGSRIQVSTAGGRYPRWRGDGLELFYKQLDGMMMAVAVSRSESPKFGVPKPLFRTSAGLQVASSSLGDYAVSADGERFLVNIPDASASSRLTVTLNWPSLVRR